MSDHHGLFDREVNALFDLIGKCAGVLGHQLRENFAGQLRGLNVATTRNVLAAAGEAGDCQNRDKGVQHLLVHLDPEK